MKFFKVLISVLLLSQSSMVLSHSGGLNSDGCHNDNINGGYHCHSGSSNSSSSGGSLAPNAKDFSFGIHENKKFSPYVGYSMGDYGGGDIRKGVDFGIYVDKNLSVGYNEVTKSFKLKGEYLGLSYSPEEGYVGLNLEIKFKDNFYFSTNLMY